MNIKRELGGIVLITREEGTTTQLVRLTVNDVQRVPVCVCVCLSARVYVCACFVCEHASEYIRL
jgi:hypothetical protein